MRNQPPLRAGVPVINRVSDAMAHASRYSFKGVTRLANDAGVHPASVSRLINGRLNPSFTLIARIVDALERALRVPIDPRELVAEEGKFKTSSMCAVLGCIGCIPQTAYDDDNSLKPHFKHVRPGEWVTSQYPDGFNRKATL